ncbi:tumor suppressor ARF-like isoform X1 [Chionomys nivalis]|uniref:tumor suppressor ARF-like isoform X1 n=1 Tax=Chionomys nivalis TaxID=269649 RepID=UPI0025996396|nr:tumor suppressor ARF-like isoform X1 [Chionomys nivalis]
MGYRFLVTVRIRERADRPPRVKAFVVRFPRSSRHGSASRALAVVALVLMLRRSQRRGRPLHAGPGDDDGQRPSSQIAAALRRGAELRGSSHPLPTSARCSAGGLLGHSGSTTPGGSAAGCA